jgi:DMSO/TMAO reductase YedYZ molybdopterin-dependent catalytic subunit
MPKTFLPVTRRDFGRLAGAAGVTISAAGTFPRLGWAAAQNTSAANIITGKSSQMDVLNAKLGVMETPIELLRQHRITPKELLFIRFHFPHEGMAAWYGTTTAPPDDIVKNWKLSVTGLVQRPREVTIAELRDMAQEKRVSVLQCAGNGRSFYAAKQKAVGGQWKNGGMGNVSWEGVPLRQFLEDMKLMPADGAQWLTAQAWDQPATPEGSDFAKSYHLAAPALDHAILALKMNGDDIPAAHGGPVRLIIPGYYGNMNVKMLTSLLFEAEETPSFYQRTGYRMPKELPAGDGFRATDYTIFNSEPTYGHAIKSVIFSPLPIDNPKRGAVEVTGVAFNDGEAPITKVEVSTDGGDTWANAEIEKPDSPWAWHHFKAKGKLASGKNTIMSRATDALGRTQPLDGLTRWQPRGYEWNGVEHLELTV